jgi:predicted ATP-grasp superfamily ATP-dependent carboligase
MASALLEDRPAEQRRPTAPPPTGAIVIGSDYRALGAVRSLGRHGIPVCVLEHGDDRLAALSRYAESRPWPEGEASRLDYLLRLPESMRGWLVIPSADETAAFVSRHHSALAARYTLTTPPWPVFRVAYDKRESYAFADRVGVDRPWTLQPRCLDDLADVDVTFPAVIKPAVKFAANKLTVEKAWRVDSLDELRARYAEALALMPARALVVQELVPGGGESQFSYAALLDEGRPVATIVARRTRQYPADFGRASTMVETVDCDDVVEPSERLLGELRYTGIVELEYKHDLRDGRFKLLDINPRLWGWHTLGAAAGVDFTHLLWLQACGAEIPFAAARPGVRWIRGTTDTPTALRELLRRRLSLRAYTDSFRGPRERAIFAADDPLPGLAEVPMILSILARRLAHGSA